MQFFKDKMISTSKPKAAATSITSVVNRFDTLAVEDSSDERTLGCQTDEATNIGRQIESYRAKQKRDFQKDETKRKGPSKLPKRIRKEDTCHRRLYDKTY